MQCQFSPVDKQLQQRLYLWKRRAGNGVVGSGGGGGGGGGEGRETTGCLENLRT